MEANMEGIEGIFHVNVNCSNLDRSLAFYQMLGFRVVQDMLSGGGPKLDKGMGLAKVRARGALMAIGDDKRRTLLDLIEWENPKTEGKAYPHLAHIGVCRIALRTPNVPKVYEELKSKGVEFMSEPQVFDGGVAFVCFRDPDGTFLELINLPDP
jgi:glyoxylase I family protein